MRSSLLWEFLGLHKNLYFHGKIKLTCPMCLMWFKKYKSYETKNIICFQFVINNIKA